jgi:hypothetical protein
MSYRFTRSWSRASGLVGAGVFLLALLGAWWIGFSGDEAFEPFPSAARILAALSMSLVGLFAGGTMIVAGQVVSVVLDRRELLEQIRNRLEVMRRKGVDG